MNEMKECHFAVLLTVYNRKNVTLQGLESFYKAIAPLPKSYKFEVYMTDDGCTDGTSEAVKEHFPEVKILREKGGLYWGGGMNAAWIAASQNKDYDYYIWLNDDAELYDNAMLQLFEVIKEEGNDTLVSGVFEDDKHNISYGGKTDSKALLPPGTTEEVIYMNGNLVLIPRKIFREIGYIDKWFVHGGGDYDYGLRAKKKGFEIKLTNGFVGMTSRHDKKVHYTNQYPLKKRLRMLYSKKSNPIISFRLYYRHKGLIQALKIFISRNYWTFFPKEK